MVVAGFFDTSILKQEHPDDWEPLLIHNGVTVLIGTARTMYADLSAASPVGRVVIPAVDAGKILNNLNLSDEDTPGE